MRETTQETNENTNLNHSENSNQHSMMSISSAIDTYSSNQNCQSRGKSKFSSFMNSISTNNSMIHLVGVTSNSFTRELNIYRSLATKEFQNISDNESDPDASEFW